MQTDTFTPAIAGNLKTQLSREFLKKCKTNPAYSLRAFAKYLSVDQSLLSKIMSGKRKISYKLAEQIAPKIKVKLSDFSKGELLPSANYTQILDDQIEVISEWYHFAILELIKTKKFQNDITWIAERLGIHVHQCREALTRLSRLGFLNFKSGKFELSKPNNTWTNTVATSIARQELQKSLTEKSKQSIDEISFEMREHGSLTVAIDTRRLPEFKEKLKQIRKELDTFMQPEGIQNNYNEVYQLTISLFPLTKLKEKKI